MSVSVLPNHTLPITDYRFQKKVAYRREAEKNKKGNPPVETFFFESVIGNR